MLSWKDSFEGKGFLILWGQPILAKPKEEFLSRAFKDAVKMETWRKQTEKGSICEYPPLGNVTDLATVITCGHRLLSPGHLLQHRSKTFHVQGPGLTGWGACV